MQSVLADTPSSALPRPSLWTLGEPTILRHDELKRPEGYGLPGERTLAITVGAGGFKATGYGEGIDDLAEKRAYSEAIERLALFAYCHQTGSRESSNGWAAHVTPNLAVDAAILELIERDVALNNWENGGPFYLLPQSLWPQELLSWDLQRPRRYEFHDLQILLSANENGACISALLFNAKGNFVAGHGSARMLDKAILSAAHECFRAAHSVLRFEHFQEVKLLHSIDAHGHQFDPGAHSLAYAYTEKLPKEVQIDLISEERILAAWRKHQASFGQLNRAELDITLLEAGSRLVARVKSPKFRQIFWGPCTDDSKTNRRPHFVG